MAVVALLSLPGSALAGYENAVREALKDPDSARFYGTKTFPNGNACGYVNAKNSYGGYAGKTPFAYISGRAILDFDTYGLACEIASNPAKFAARRQAELDVAATNERQQKAKDAAERSRLEQESFAACTGQRQELLEDAKHNIDQLHTDIAPTSLKGSVELLNKSALDLSSCPPKFLLELTPAVNDERQRLFQIYCVDRRTQRLRESMSDSGAYRNIAKACGVEYARALIPTDFSEFSSQIRADKRANPQVWECRILRDYAIVGDKLSKAYWGKDFKDKCSTVQDQLD